MDRVMVVGAGTMGAGIAQVVAEMGCRVVLTDVSDELVQRGLRSIEKNLQRSLERGRLTAEQKTDILDRVIAPADPGVVEAEAAEVDLVLEAIVEDMPSKKSLYRELDPVCPSKTLFASNTSALSITEMAAATTRPDRFIGLHFFNPAPVMQLVEVVSGVMTSQETLGTSMEFIERAGKSPVQVVESPGFVVNRLLVPMINEAIFMVGEGVASVADIDSAMRLGANHPLGPLALADLVGLDVCLAIMDTLHTEFEDDKYRPCPTLKKMVRAGLLGRKSGQGFYKY
jgi:3-hydroxybutyryl-CoA dehydrogenase